MPYIVIVCLLAGCGAASIAALSPSASRTATHAAAETPRAFATPTVAPGGYFIGGMDGEICEPKAGAAAGRAYWKPTEELCVHAAPGAGTGSVTYSPPVTNQTVPAADQSVDTFASRVQRLAGASYTTSLSNHDGGGFGDVTFVMHSYSASDLYRLQARPAAVKRPFFYGAFVRPGAAPYGIYTPGSTAVDPQKARDILDAGVRMSRTPLTTFFDDNTGIGGTYSFAHDDPAIAWILAHGIVPLFELDAGPKQYGTALAHTTQPLMHNPAEYANFCTAAARHLHATYPSLGTKIGAYFTTPINEPNTSYGWKATQTDDPVLYAESAKGPALYMKACYAAVKAIFPMAKIYSGELATDVAGAPTSMPSEIARWYAAGCRIGTCYDGVSLHISPIGDPSQTFTRCYEKNDGWTFACLAEMQAVARAHGDPPLHAMITETDISSVVNSNVSAGDEAGQAWWESQTLAAASKNPAIDGVFYASIDDDGLYAGNQFYGTSLVDTSGTVWRRKPSFYTYCRFAKFPAPCADPIAPAASARKRLAGRAHIASASR